MKTNFLSLFAGTLVLVPCFWVGSAFAVDDPYAQLPGYQWDQPRTSVMAIEADIRGATPERLATIEAKLLEVLQSPISTHDAKSWICRTLRVAGSERAIQILAPLLLNEDLAPDARFALRSLPGPKADEALRQALPKAGGSLQAGIIGVLGARGDRQAVPLLAPLAGNAETAIAEAALDALGHIGGEAALKTLQAAPAPEQLQRVREQALLMAADSVLAEGKVNLAAATFRSLFQQKDYSAITPAALRGLVMAEKTPPELLTALNSDSAVLAGVAARLLNESSDPATIKSVLEKFESCAPAGQLAVLGNIGHPAALPVVRKAAESQSEEIRVAALAALSRVGDASTVPLLTRAAATGQGPVQAAARTSLLVLRGRDVEEALLAGAQSGESASRVEAIQALNGRNAKSAAGALLKLAGDADAGVRTAAIRSLGTLAAPKDIPGLFSLLNQAGTAENESLENAFVEAALRMPDRNSAVAPLLKEFSAAAPDKQTTLLRVAARVPSSKSLKALRTSLKNADTGVKDAAIRGLAEWPEPVAIPDLLAVLRGPCSEMHHVLTLRGLVRLSSELPPDQASRSLADAMTLCKSVPEKKQVLGALAEVPNRTALEQAMTCLGEKDLELEAATAVASLAKQLLKTEPALSAMAMKKILEICTSPEARMLAQDPHLQLTGMINIASQGKASSPDGLEKDGVAKGEQAAIDGDPATYWDETNGAKLYRLVVEFPEPKKIFALSIVGYKQHNFAPKDFEILCDGKTVRKITGATYQDNFLVLPIEEMTARSVELKITGYYGQSPAIRELGIYQRADGKSERPEVKNRILSVEAKNAIRVLLLSGQNNHDWKTTTPKLQSILAESGRFSVEVTDHPEQCTAETFARCEVIVCNWNCFGKLPVTNWPAATREAFLNFVRNGGGHVVVHAGGCSFSDWPDYQQIAAVWWQGGKTSHGRPHEFTVQLDSEHPITRDIAPFKSTDELWINPGVHPTAKIIATAEEQPLVMTTQYGKGRCFGLLLGHSAPFMETPGFQALLLRGTEWAATGKVTIAPFPSVVRSPR